jgi:hypothetical protein
MNALILSFKKSYDLAELPIMQWAVCSGDIYALQYVIQKDKGDVAFAFSKSRSRGNIYLRKLLTLFVAICQV